MQDIFTNGYYTKAQVDTAITNAITGGTVDLSNYFTKAEVNAAIAALPIPDMTLYYNKSEVDALIAAI